MDLNKYLQECKKEWQEIDYSVFIYKLSISILLIAIPFIFLNIFLSKELDNFWLRVGVSSSVVLFLSICWKGVKRVMPQKTSALFSFSFINEIDKESDLMKICFFLWFIVIFLILYDQGIKHKYGTAGAKKK